MNYLSPPASFGRDLPERQSPEGQFEDPLVAPPDAQSANPVEPPGTSSLLTVLHESLAAGTHSPEAILRATTDAARILTGANGTAIALSANSAVVCRARSGEIAPEVGAGMNVDSGISGECFRSSQILRCDDAQTDSRVDAEVCASLEIRSIAVIPLRGPVGTIGILEAFSSQAYAFSDEHLNVLEQLGQIAEVAYARESGENSRAPIVVTVPIPVPVYAPPAVSRVELPVSTMRQERLPASMFEQPAPIRKRRYWILGVVAAVLLSASAVVWWTWHEPVGEAATTPATAPTNTSPDPNVALVAPLYASQKPSPRVGADLPDGSRTKDVVKNAADIGAVTGDAATAPLNSGSRDADLPAVSGKSTAASAATETAVEPPPVVITSEENSLENNDKLANLVSTSTPRPELEVRVSEGVTQANLIHKVAPVYPQAALAKRIGGSVVLDASITTDGTVGEIKLMRGDPVLAKAATSAIRQWRYSPALLNGAPTPVQKEITIIFKLP
jgi:TonB family protein